MLELRPNCEWCNRDLPPDDPQARICSYECTYCAACVEQYLRDVCPTCGGGFAPRPIRPAREWRPGSGLGRQHHPASRLRRTSPWNWADLQTMAARVAAIPPAER